MTTLPSDLASAEAVLGATLRRLRPTGPGGFEGLVADVVADLSGLVIRLAKSGSQFGRDASSPPDPFAVALEAKRYDDHVRLEDLAGKVILAAQALGGDIDVWAVCATSEVGDDTVRQLAAILEEQGVTLLVLDWAARPLPPLGVALAAARDTTLRWLARSAPDVDAQIVSDALDTIAAHPAFTAQAARLRAELDAARVGLDALRRRATAWLRARLEERAKSRQSFGQYVTVADPSAPAVPRAATADLSREAAVAPERPTVVVVLGGEGVGKTWLVAQWLADLADAPVPVWVAGRRVRHLVPGDPLESLARLLAEQDGDSTPERVRGWRRRLARWQARGAADGLRLVVVLDGLNEHQSLPWASLVGELAHTARALGGLVILTCRPVYWTTSVTPRLGRDIDVRRVEVDGYSDAELSAVLARAGFAAGDLLGGVREFVRNPRVCAVALDLLGRLTLAPDELTVERLLLEYWRARLEERGDLVGHDTADFHNLLRSHARAWQAYPRRGFDRDAWAEHSGAARRLGHATMLNDLSDIVEGRFLTTDLGDVTKYSFRHEALPFALALLINAEIRDVVRGADHDAGEWLDRALDPVRGFDFLADVVAAAVGLACWDESYPEAACVSLVRAWFTLQNVSDESTEAMAAYLATRPEPFLVVAEMSDVSIRDDGGPASLPGVLHARRGHPNVRPALDARIPRWLGCWSCSVDVSAFREVAAERQAKRAARIAEQLAQLSAGERGLFRRLTHETPRPTAVDLDRLATWLLAAQPLASFAEALFAWSLVQAVAYDLGGAGDALAWVVRLNSADPEATGSAVRALVADVVDPGSASAPFRKAGAILLRLVGDHESAALADSLDPLRRTSWSRRVEQLCDTDPFDPASPEPTNLDVARTALQNLAPADLWVALSQTIEDSSLDEVTPGLARFDPDAIVTTLRDVVATACERTGVRLRQLAWHVRALSPLFDARCVAAVRVAYDRLCEDSAGPPDRDRDVILAQLAASLAPHVTSDNQLKRLLTFPEDKFLPTMLFHGLKPMDSAVLEARLTDAAQAGRTRDLARTLLFAARSASPLSDESKRVVASALDSTDRDLTLYAAELVFRADDPVLDHALLDSAAVGARDSLATESYLLDRALATVVARRGRTDLLHLVSDQYRGAVAQALEGNAVAALSDHVDGALNTLLAPVRVDAPADLEASVSVRDSWAGRTWTVRNAAAAAAPSGAGNLLTEAHRMADESAARYAAFAQYQRVLLDNGAAALHDVPHVNALRAVVDADPARAAAWVRAILAVDSPRILRQLYNLAVGIAGAYGTHDAQTAARLLHHLRENLPLVRVLFGVDGIDLWDHALFTASHTDAIDALRRERFAVAMTDEAIERATVAAEACGAGDWLAAYVDELIASPSAGDQARGLTITGLRRPTSDAEDILSREWGNGFLGDVAASARTNYRRAVWAELWLTRAAAATDPGEYWRWATLGVRLADVRHTPLRDELSGSAVVQQFDRDLFERLRNASERRTKKRRDTLFGLRAPDRHVVGALLSSSE